LRKRFLNYPVEDSQIDTFIHPAARNLVRVAILLAAALVSSCAAIPRGAALQSEILKEAESKDSPFAVYKVTRGIAKEIAGWKTSGETPPHFWLGHRRASGDPTIKAGDKINLAIWDSGENSLLAGEGQRTVAMQDLTVSTEGTIFVPYIGKVSVSGLTADEARTNVQHQMEGIITAAQVQLAVTSGTKNAVDIVGGVTQPGNYPMIDETSLTVLSLISRAGGIPQGVRNPQVKLMRGGRVYSTSVGRLYRNPSFDTVLTGGDKVIIEEDKRYFTALGASGKEELIYFSQDRVNALEAMSIMGGLSDLRADPQGILILREYPAGAVKTGKGGPSEQQVVLVLDLTSADGLFSAKNIYVASGDTVLDTESIGTAIQSIMSLFDSTLRTYRRLP